MRFIRDNFPYVILGLVALVLIFITISLQTALSGTQDPATTATGSFAAIRAQLASWIAPGTGEQPEPLAAPATTTEVANAAAGNNAVSAANDLPTGQTNASPINSAEPSADNAASSGLTGMAATLYGAENLTVSEDDEILAAVIADTPTAIGFFGYAYCLEHQDRLRTIAVRLPDGQIVGPNAVSVANGLYPLARPLYLYTSPSILREKPQVERFIGCYLNRLPQAVTDVGYLLPSRALFDRALQSFSAACQWCRREALSDHLLATTVPVCDFTDVRAGAITVVGSSTVKPISERMATIVAELGFGGEVTVDGSGTGAGFKNFCGEGVGDIVDASRPIKNEERAACNERGVLYCPFRGG
ncbi:MAG: hypothetical protein R2932_38035 [Caldilineaceae bacterium]